MKKYFIKCIGINEATDIGWEMPHAIGILLPTNEKELCIIQLSGADTEGGFYSKFISL
jgi:hypothetical protein